MCMWLQNKFENDYGKYAKYLEVRTIFSLFVLKKHMLGFAQIISVFRTGWRFARVGVGYPVSGTCSRSSFCKWLSGACWF